MDPNFADKVLKTAVEAGNDQKAIQQHLNSLDASGQEKFIQETASALGISQENQKQEAPEASTYNPSASESALLGAANVTGLAQKLAPASAMLEKGIGAVTDLGRPEGEKLYQDVPVSTIADETRQMLQAGQQEHPIASAVGQGAASAALLGPFGAAGAAPLVQGGVAAGQEFAESGDPVKAAMSGGVAAATSGILRKFLPGVSKVASGAADTADEVATAAARKSLGYGSAAIKKAGGVPRVNSMIKTLRENGLFSKGISKEAMSEAVDEMANKAGNAIDAVYSSEAGNVVAGSSDDLISSLKNSLQHEAERVKSIAPEKLNQLDSIYSMIKQYAPNGQMNMRQLWQLTKDLGNIAWEKGVTNESRQMYQDAWKVLKDSTLEALQHYSKTEPEIAEATKALIKNNEIFHSAVEGGKMLAETANKEAGNKIFGMRHIISSAIGSHFGPAAGMATGAAHLAADKYGAQVVSKGAEGVSKGLSVPLVQRMLKTPGKLGKFAQPLLDAANRGGTSLGVAHYVMMQSSPEYREKMEKASEEDAKQPTE